MEAAEGFVGRVASGSGCLDAELLFQKRSKTLNIFRVFKASLWNCMKARAVKKEMKGMF